MCFIIVALSDIYFWSEMGSFVYDVYIVRIRGFFEVLIVVIAVIVVMGFAY